MAPGLVACSLAVRSRFVGVLPHSKAAGMKTDGFAFSPYDVRLGANTVWGYRTVTRDERSDDRSINPAHVRSSAIFASRRELHHQSSDETLLCRGTP